MSDEAYYEGTSNYINIIRDYASSGFPKNNNSSNSDGLPPIVTAMIISLVITIIIMVILINKNTLLKIQSNAFFLYCYSLFLLYKKYLELFF